MGCCCSTKVKHVRKKTSRTSQLEQIRISQAVYLKRRLKEAENEGCAGSGDIEEQTCRAWEPAHVRLERTDCDSQIRDESVTAFTRNPAQYVYPFENVVFEGGGTKGLAYCGAVRVLEDCGVWTQIRRLAGASAGAMMATLLAVGYNSYEIEEFLSQDLSDIFLDHSCGILSLLPNLIRKFGWNSGRKVFHWFGEKMKEKTGNADVTFEEVYKVYGKEVCIVVTNLNQMNTEYFHPKTTPDMPIRIAVSMSMAIPGMFQATTFARFGKKDTYVDGGVLCNYPAHCFDGWWLSMKPEDTLLRRLQPLHRLPYVYDRHCRFGEFNKATLGLMVYADDEQDVLRYNLEKRVRYEPAQVPDTSLSRKKSQNKRFLNRASREHRRIIQAVDEFLKVLTDKGLDSSYEISLVDLEEAFSDEDAYPQTYADVLFGPDVSVQDALRVFDSNKDGKIQLHELVRFIEANGVSLQERCVGYRRQKIKNVISFFGALQNSLLTNVKYMHLKENDLERTAGINTGHVEATDFVLEKEDRDFLVDQGWRATRAFLQCYIESNNPPRCDGSGDTELLPEQENGQGCSILNTTE